MPPSLDSVDSAILELLHKDARDMTAVEIADRLPHDVSDGTIRNRIKQMRTDGIIERCVPLVDYETAGFPFRMLFTCTAPIAGYDTLADRLGEIPNVVGIRQMASSEANVRVTAVATDRSEVNCLIEQFTDLGLSVERTELIYKESTSLAVATPEPPAQSQN